MNDFARLVKVMVVSPDCSSPMSAIHPSMKEAFAVYVVYRITAPQAYEAPPETLLSRSSLKTKKAVTKYETLSNC